MINPWKYHSGPAARTQLRVPRELGFGTVSHPDELVQWFSRVIPSSQTIYRVFFWNGISAGRGANHIFTSLIKYLQPCCHKHFIFSLFFCVFLRSIGHYWQRTNHLDKCVRFNINSTGSTSTNTIRDQRIGFFFRIFTWSSMKVLEVLTSIGTHSRSKNHHH